MSDATTGIIVGVTVALAGHLIGSLFDLVRGWRRKTEQKRAVLRMLAIEAEGHKGYAEHFISECDRGGRFQYSDPVDTDVYDKVFLTHWSLLPSELSKQIAWHYKAARSFNYLQPLDQDQKEYVESFRNSADRLIGKLEKTK